MIGVCSIFSSEFGVTHKILLPVGSKDPTLPATFACDLRLLARSLAATIATVLNHRTL